MTSELRPAEEVATEVATALTKKPANDRTLGEYLAAAVIEADRAPLLAEIERLRGALEHIGIYGCGMLNQPAAMNGPEEVWLKQRIFEMERTARAALGDSHGET